MKEIEKEKGRTTALFFVQYLTARGKGGKIYVYILAFGG